MSQKYRFVLRAKFPAVYAMPEGSMTEDVLFRSDPILAQSDDAQILKDWLKRMDAHPLVGPMLVQMETEVLTGHRDGSMVWMPV